MTEPAPPGREAARPGGCPDQEEGARGRGSSGLARGTDGLVVAIDGLIRRIEAVWNETPETLAMLAEWADTLQAQKRELQDWQRAVGYRPINEPSVRRMGREAARDVGLIFLLGRRLRQLARHGERLRAAQADAAIRSDDPAHRAMLQRHHARTERHLGRLRERLHPGR